MDINYFNIYTAVALNENKEFKDLQRILEQASKLKNLDNIDKAKEYIKNIWRIESNIENFSLCEKCILNVTDTESTYCINLVYENKDVTYYYER